MKHTSKVTRLLGLLVFTLFALCILTVLLTGADIYSDLTDRGQASYARRTASQYITTRVRQSNDIRVEDFDGCDALVIRETIGNRVCFTRVYCYDGFIRELFTIGTGTFSPEDGEKILEAEALSLSVQRDLLTAALFLPDGSTQQLTLLLRGGKEAAP